MRDEKFGREENFLLQKSISRKVQLGGSPQQRLGFRPPWRRLVAAHRMEENLAGLLRPQGVYDH